MSLLFLLDNLPYMKTFKELLSTRSKNGISRCFGPQILDTPTVIADAGPARLRRTNQLGPKSLREIAEVLLGLGYIKDPDQWLKIKTAN